MGMIEEAGKPMIVNTKNTFGKLKKIRSKLAVKHTILPTMLINDRVISNIHTNSPKNIRDLLRVDGISDDFVTNYGLEFMKEYLKKPKKHNKKPKELVFKLYKEGKTMKEIADTMGVQLRTIEQYVLDIFENNDEADIDCDYFDLSEEAEEEIRKAIAKVGVERLRPIKDILNAKISYAQIKLCMLIMKVE